MFGVVCADGDRDFAHALADALCAEGFDARASGAGVPDVADADAVIMDLTLDGAEGISVIRQIDVPVILLTGVSNADILKLVKADYILLKPASVTEISRILHRIRARADAQSEAVARLLREMGIKSKLRGFACLKTAICRYMRKGSVADAYSYTAREMNTKPSCVERNIRNAVEIAFTTGNIEKLNEIFGYSVSSEKGKPTNSEFIALIADRFKYSRQAASGA